MLGNKAKYLIVLFTLAFFSTSFSQDKKINPKSKVILSSGNYTLGKLIDSLTKQGISLTYDAKNIPLDYAFELKTNNPSLENVLNSISQNSPVTYAIIENYIIVKKKNIDNNIVVSGRIIDSSNGEPVISANISILNSQKGCITDTNGFFSINLPASEYTLSISCLGYKQVEYNVQSYTNQTLNIAINPAHSEIDEVIISTEKNIQEIQNNGKVIEVVNSKDISKISTNNAVDALHARMPGVWVIKSSGLPGDHQNIRVRGISSIIATLDPLFVVDGFQVPIINLYSMGISDLNANDIDNITVLKDASSTNLYGYQGGNGVILISTKNGSENQINFSSTFGIQKFNKKYELMNSYEFLTTMNNIYKKFNRRIYAYYPKYDSTISNDDWQDKIFKTGVVSEFNLSGSGNEKGYFYYMSGSYSQQQGIIQNTNYERYTFTSKIKKTFKERITLNLMYWGSIQANHNNLDNIGGNNILYEGTSKPPSFKTLKLKPSKTITDLINYNDPDTLINNTNKNLNIIINNFGANTKIKLLNDLFLLASSSLSFRTNTFDIDYINMNQNKDEKYYLKNKENYIILDQQMNLQYHKQINNHEIIWTAGYKNYLDNAYWGYDSTNYIIENKQPDNGIFLKGSLILNGFKGIILRSIQSKYSQISYNYKSKYFLQLSINNQTLKEDETVNIERNFPSTAFLWNISKEPIFENLNWLNDLSLYANWGTSGNYPLNGLSNFRFSDRGYIYGDSLIYGSSIFALANRKLKEESINEYSLGLKTNIFDERVELKINYFNKINKNLILIKSIPAIYNGGNSYINVGTLITKGWEYSFLVLPIKTSHFSWYSHFNITTGTQVISKLNLTYSDTARSDELSPDFILNEGDKFGLLRGYKYYGYWSNEDELNKNTKEYNNIRNVEGMKFSKSREVLGKSIPDYSWNWLNTFTIKNVTIDLLLYGVSGITKYNATRAATYSTGTNKEITRFISDSVSGFSSVTFLHSSYFFENASYIKIKQLRFSYQSPKKIFNVAMATFSLSFENILTLTTYKGYDPESTIYTENGFSDNAIDHGAYPNPISAFAIISLKF